MATFIPDPDKTGDFIKPEFGTGPRFLGFKPDMGPVYEFLGSVQDPLIKKQAEDFKVAWAAFNAAICFPPSFQSTLVSVRDILGTIQAVNNALLTVLDALAPFADININLLEAVIQAVLLLIGRVIDLLNPRVSTHLLVIPPRLGNVVSNTSNSTNRLVRTLESLTAVKDSSIALLNSSLNSIPSMAGLSFASATGPEYLLSTITSKINDVTDPNRPALRASSHYAGVGLFVGAANINSVLAQWDKIVGLLGLITSDRSDTSIPAAPVVVGPTKIYSTDTLDNMVVSPTRPIGLLGNTTIRGKAVWSHVARFELVSNSFVSDTDISKLDTELAGALSDTATVKALVGEAGFPTQFLEGKLKTVEIWALSNTRDTEDSSTILTPQQTWKLGDKGTLALFAVDIYTVKVDATDVYVARKSKPSKCQYDSTLKGIINHELYVDLKGSAAARPPRWLSAGYTVNLLPPVFATLNTIIELVKAWLTALTDEALNVFSSIINSLKRSLQVISKILTAIDEFTILLQQLLSLNLSCSAITFAGEGGKASLLGVFNQYFKNSGSPDSFSTTGVDLSSSSAQLSADLATAVSSADSLVDIDQRAKEILDTKNRARKQRESELDAVLNQEYRWVTGDAGKVSPTFDAKDTTAGLVLLAYSETAANVRAAKLLFDLLFNAESDTSSGDTSTNEAIAAQSGLPVTSVFSDIPQGLKINEKIETGGILFGENMQPVTSTDQSPFRFCP